MKLWVIKMLLYFFKGQGCHFLCYIIADLLGSYWLPVYELPVVHIYDVTSVIFFLDIWEQIVADRILYVF